MCIDHGNKIIRRVARESRSCKIWILGDKILMCHDTIREDAASTTRDTDLLAWSVVVLENSNSLAPCRRLRGTKQSGRTSTQDNDIVMGHSDYFDIISDDVELNTPAEMRTKYNPAG